MDKILISACLLGSPVRCDGKGKTLAHDLIRRWSSSGYAIVITALLTADPGMPILV